MIPELIPGFSQELATTKTAIVGREAASSTEPKGSAIGREAASRQSPP